MSIVAKEFQHVVYTDNKVCPDLVDPEIYGHHSSKVLNKVRIWRFESETGSKQFQNAVDNGFFQRTASHAPH